jgi:hypothetical protein
LRAGFVLVPSPLTRFGVKNMATGIRTRRMKLRTAFLYSVIRIGATPLAVLDLQYQEVKIFGGCGGLTRYLSRPLATGAQFDVALFLACGGRRYRTEYTLLFITVMRERSDRRRELT